LVVQDKEIVRC